MNRLFELSAKTLRLFHKSIIDQNFSESYYIDPPTETIMRKLILIWAAVWLSFLITFDGREIIMFIFWSPLAVALYHFVYIWKKFGFSPLIYYLINIVVLSVGYGFSRIVHYAIEVIING